MLGLYFVLRTWYIQSHYYELHSQARDVQYKYTARGTYVVDAVASSQQDVKKAKLDASGPLGVYTVA